MLDSNDCFIVNAGESGIFAWVGVGATDAEKTSALGFADGFVKDNGLPSNTPVSRVIEGNEPEAFKQYFYKWDDEEAGKSNFYSSIAQTIPDAGIYMEVVRVENPVYDSGAGIASDSPEPSQADNATNSAKAAEAGIATDSGEPDERMRINLKARAYSSAGNNASPLAALHAAEAKRIKDAAEAAAKQSMVHGPNAIAIDGDVTVSVLILPLPVVDWRL